MPDYSKGQIYTIRNRNDDKKIYVGSTLQPLYKRFHQHKINSKKKNV
jgi:predicted GIY-YIG superfamily endonuclease